FAPAFPLSLSEKSFGILQQSSLSPLAYGEPLRLCAEFNFNKSYPNTNPCAFKKQNCLLCGDESGLPLTLVPLAPARRARLRLHNAAQDFAASSDKRSAAASIARKAAASVAFLGPAIRQGCP